MAASNPYIAGSPVRGRGKFIGRIDVLRDVARVLQNPNANALVLFGQRRIGKTSVLLHIERELATQKQFTPFYFDLQDKASLPLPEVLYRMAQKVSVITKIPLPRREQFDHEGRFFRDTFIPEVTKTGKNRGLVLLLDEFDVLDVNPQEQLGPAFSIYLRDWMKNAQSVQFLFVLGRRPEELSVNALSTFKSIQSRKVSLMGQEDSDTIIRQSERDGSLRWGDDAVERVWYWTQGHPYFMQLLCHGVWERVFEEEPENTRPVAGEVVDAVIDGALERGSNALQWIWNSLSPAERVVMAAMAEARGEYINQDELTDILNRSKVRLILRELEVAPETLIRWDLLRPSGSGFRFAVPLLRRWVAAEKPLRLVKTELDNLEPLAENLYRSGEGFYAMGNLDEAERQLRNALNVNPNHFRARLMLGHVLVGQGNPSDAVEELEPAYEFDPPSAKPGLITALLSLSETQNESEQLSTFNRILAIDPIQHVALKKKQAILRDRAETSERNEDLDAAMKLFQQIDDKESVNRILRKLRRREVEDQLATVAKYEEVEDWSSVIAIYQKLLIKYPEDGDWQARLNDARTQARLAETYTRALNVLQQGDSKLAQRLFGNILGIQPDYKEAAVYLLMASRGLRGEALAQEIRRMNMNVPESQESRRYAEKSDYAEYARNSNGFDRSVPPDYPEHRGRRERMEYTERQERPRRQERRDTRETSWRTMPVNHLERSASAVQREWASDETEPSRPVAFGETSTPAHDVRRETGSFFQDTLPGESEYAETSRVRQPEAPIPQTQPVIGPSETTSGIAPPIQPPPPVPVAPVQNVVAEAPVRKTQPISTPEPIAEPPVQAQPTTRKPVPDSPAQAQPTTRKPEPGQGQPAVRKTPPEPPVQKPPVTQKPAQAQKTPVRTQPVTRKATVEASADQSELSNRAKRPAVETPAAPPAQAKQTPPAPSAVTKDAVSRGNRSKPPAVPIEPPEPATPRPQQTDRELRAKTSRETPSAPAVPGDREDVSAAEEIATKKATRPIELLNEPESEDTDQPIELIEVIEPIAPIVPPEMSLTSEEVDSDLGQEFRFDVIIVNERGEEVSHRRGKAYQQIDDLGGILLEMVYVPGGTFSMGSPAEEESHSSHEEPQRQVTVIPFYIGKFPVTQAQWNLIMGNNPSRFKGTTRPVENVSWKDAVEFCQRIGQKTGHPYRLPSEAEWEYACRAGATTPFHFGKTIMPVLANYDCRSKYASGLKGTFRKKTMSVGSFSPNTFGLYDLHGNVWEWCTDPWHINYQGAPSDGSVWSADGKTPFRVLRGGSWSNEPRDCRSASRERNEFDSWFNNAIGLRVVVSVVEWKKRE